MKTNPLRLALLLGLAGGSLASCGSNASAPPPQTAGTDSALPSQTNTVLLPSPAGQTIKCTAVAPAMCPQS